MMRRGLVSKPLTGYLDNKFLLLKLQKMTNRTKAWVLGITHVFSPELQRRWPVNVWSQYQCLVNFNKSFFKRERVLWVSSSCSYLAPKEKATRRENDDCCSMKAQRTKPINNDHNPLFCKIFTFGANSIVKKFTKKGGNFRQKRTQPFLSSQRNLNCWIVVYKGHFFS